MTLQGQLGSLTENSTRFKGEADALREEVDIIKEDVETIKAMPHHPRPV